MEKGERKRLVVIDGKSVFYRGYYAMPNLATKDGTPTGGVFGFATMALQVIKQLRPDYVAVAWDKPKTNIRRRLELYPAYKAGRKPAPADFYEQIPVLHELLQAFGWPLYEMDDYEADDIMGALAVQARAAGLETLLVTSDLDMLQLINGNVKVYALKKGLSNIELYSPASFTAKYGINVDQFLDLKSLKGDSSDNIPGVPGIGEKTAIQLLQEHKTLDGVYDNLPLIKDSVRKKLEAGKDSAYLSKQLASIWTDAPIKLNLDAMDGSHSRPEHLLEILERLEFRSLARQLPDVMQVSLAETKSKNSDSGTLAVGKSIIVDSEEKLAKLATKSEVLYVHSHCGGKHGKNPQTLILSNDGKTTFALDLTKLDRGKVVNWLTTTCRLPSAKLIGYDVKSTLKLLLELGVDNLPAVKHDVLIGAFLINSLRREQTLTDLASADAGYDGLPLDDISPDELVQRASEVTAAVQALYKQQSVELKEMPKLLQLTETIEWPVVPVLARMERRGILLDTQYLAVFAEQLSDMISDIEQQIYGYAGKEFNIGSPSQLAEVLFDDLQLSKQGIKKGKTGYSTAASELEKLWDEHPIIPFISQYREVVKLKNTYVDTLPQQVDGQSRVHTTFNLTIAQTGRLSSTDPNLQNIPVRSELGKRIRTAFVAGKGRKLVSADYSQFELRLAAAMSGDANMVNLFNAGADIHQATAAEVYGRELEDVTKEMRYAAKAVNFGILYGMSPHGLSRATHMTYEQSKDFIDKYFAARGPLLAYLDELKKQAKEQGYVETLFGRRRPMPDIKSSNFIVRSSAERAAMNMPVQGTEADLMKLAMIYVDKKLREEFPSADQLLQIHDSILVECDAQDAEKIAELLRKEMEAIAPDLLVKLRVDTTIGDNWGEL